MKSSTIIIRRNKYLNTSVIANVIDNSKFQFSIKTCKDDLIITIADNRGRLIRLNNSINLRTSLNNLING